MNHAGAGHALDNEALKMAIKKDNSKTCGEFSERFQVSEEPAPRREGLRVCFSLLSQLRKVPIFDRMLTSGEKYIQTLVITTEPCASRHKTTSVPTKDHAFYLN